MTSSNVIRLPDIVTPGYTPISRVRYLKARLLVDEAGSLIAFADRIDKQQSQVSSFAGKNPSKGIGGKLAREIETAFGRPFGWMDVPDAAYSNRVPILAWSDVSAIISGSQPPSSGCDGGLACPEDHSLSTFALRVAGDSMTADSGGGYIDGEVIFVDPLSPFRDQSDVVVVFPDGTTTFRRMQVTPEGVFLVALNSSWPSRVVRLCAHTRICGPVIGAYRSRL